MASSNTFSRQAELIALAKGSATSRRVLEKTLERARKRFAMAKKLYDQCSKEMTNVTSRLGKAEEEMEASKKELLRISRHIQTMDLVGGEAIKNRGDIDTFMIGGKEFVVDDDKNDAKTPYKEWKRKKEEESDVADVSDAVDSMEWGNGGLGVSAKTDIFDKIITGQKITGQRH